MALTKITGEGVGAIDSLDVTGTGGQVTVDANGHITSKQSLDAATAGGRIIGASNRGTVSQIDLAQTSSSADGGYIRFLTCDSGSTNPTERMRLLSGGGLTFNGDTAAANALDDYEEGDFTPELRASTTNPSSTISGVGKYTKIGRTVTFNFIFSNKTISGAAGNIQIANMPFAPTGAINAIFPIASHNMNSPGTFSIGYLTGGGTTMEVLNMRDATSWQNVNISNVSAFYLFVGGSYTASS